MNRKLSKEVRDYLAHDKSFGRKILLYYLPELLNKPSSVREVRAGVATMITTDQRIAIICGNNAGEIVTMYCDRNQAKELIKQIEKCLLVMD